jgi:aryl-alcohol dehydrogenase-like predicted oxidoreductase
MQKRMLGKTGISLSVVGFGGILVMNEDDATSSRLVAEAIDRGINYFDVAPSYGNAQEQLGPALAPYRDQVFLACKTLERTRKGAAKDLQNSFECLNTSSFDLYQIHGIGSMEEAKQVLAPGGAIETFIQARDEGLIRFIGFSAHDEDAALYLMEHFKFDTILFPFNWVCWYGSNFGHRVHARARELDMGILALKALALRSLEEGEQRPREKCWYVPIDNPEDARLGTRFTLSLPVTATVSPGHEELLHWLCDAAENATPLTTDEIDELRMRSSSLNPIFPQ